MSQNIAQTTRPQELSKFEMLTPEQKCIHAYWFFNYWFFPTEYFFMTSSLNSAIRTCENGDHICSLSHMVTPDDLAKWKLEYNLQAIPLIPTAIKKQELRIWIGM